MTSGIYVIEHTSGKVYVGSAVNFRRRFKKHRYELRSGAHRNPPLLAAWRKYGPEAFRFRVLMVCSPKHLLMYEQIAIDLYRGNSYNVAPVAGSRLGMKASEKSRKAASTTCKSRVGQLHPMFGKKRPELAALIRAMNANPEIVERRRLAVIASNKRRRGPLHPMYGRKRPDTAERNRNRGVP